MTNIVDSVPSISGFLCIPREKFREQVLLMLKGARKEDNELSKEENYSINKEKSVTFSKKSSNINSLTIKIILKLKTIAIIQINTEVLHITYII